MNKIVIYTAITNDYDALPELRHVDDRLDYVCFTDNPDLKSDFWKIVLLSGKEKREDKKVKILPHKYLEDYEISIWVDANYILCKNLYHFAYIALKYSNHAVFRHHENRESLEDEVDMCIKLKKADPKKLKAQLKKYRQEFENANFEIVHNAIIIRRHNDKKVKMVMEKWWEQVQNWTMRDQVSFPYVAHKYEYQYNVIRMNSLRNKWFIRVGHKK
ncbi:MAG: glycosyltransferase domain-containing protein [archaeon]